MNDSSTVEILKALADETRLTLVRKFADSKQPVLTCNVVNSCASLLELSQPTMSHHINKLVSAGVLIEHKQAKQKAYSLNRELLVVRGINIDAL